MRKFVIVMITLLVLFVFLMLNYLLWDKENLQKQSESDKVQQDYLRGQNITLQATVEEHEQTIKSLRTDHDDAKRRISDLEHQLKQADGLNDRLETQIDLKDQTISYYKQFTAEALQDVAMTWFNDISTRNYEASYKALDADYLLFGGHYPVDAYTAYISAVQSISFPQPAGGEEEQLKHETVFEILEGRGGEYEIVAIATIEVVIAEEHKEKFSDMSDGTNRLQIVFRYDHDNRAWAIYSVLEANE